MDVLPIIQKYGDLYFVPFNIGLLWSLLALPTKARIIVFRFIIEYSSLRDFYRSLGNNNNNNNNRSIFIRSFERLYFGLC